MEITKEQSAANFLNNNEEILLKNESQNNLMLGLADSILQSKRSSEIPLFYTIRDGADVCGQALRTDPDKPLILADMSEDILVFLVNKLREESVTLKGVVGPIQSVKTFSSYWSNRSELGMHQGIYELSHVIHPDYNAGSILLAEDRHYDLVREFCLGFFRDCFPKENRVSEANEAARRNIKNKTVFLWQNARSNIVSMAANTRQSKNGATISLVYTPEEYRNLGYGSKIVASLSQRILDRGKLFCNLFTDLVNTTSNSIYQKVGYLKVGESLHINFNE